MSVPYAGIRHDGAWLSTSGVHQIHSTHAVCSLRREGDPVAVTRQAGVVYVRHRHVEYLEGQIGVHLDGRPGQQQSRENREDQHDDRDPSPDEHAVLHRAGRGRCVGCRHGGR